MSLQFAYILTGIVLFADISTSEKQNSLITSQLNLFSTLDDNTLTSPLYLHTKNTLDSFPFPVNATCGTGAWHGFNESNFTSKYITLHNSRNYTCRTNIFGYLTNSARFFGNSSDIDQPSVTFYPEDGRYNVVSKTYFENVYSYKGPIYSLILTGPERLTSISFFTSNNFGGAEYCIFRTVPFGSSGDSVFTHVSNIPNESGVPAGGFKSFKFGTSCGSSARIINTPGDGTAKVSGQ